MCVRSQEVTWLCKRKCDIHVLYWLDQDSNVDFLKMETYMADSFQISLSDFYSN